MVTGRPEAQIVGQVAIPVAEDVQDRTGKCREDGHDPGRGLAADIAGHDERIEPIPFALAEHPDRVHVSVDVRNGEKPHHSPSSARLDRGYVVQLLSGSPSPVFGGSVSVLR